MDFIKNSDIEAGLEAFGRVYLCGNLKKANGVEHIQTEDYEIGMSDYSEYTFEKAHLHASNREFNYVVKGAIKVFLLSEKKEYLFSQGDLFVINTNEPYVSKCLEGTRTLFSKFPGGNDKVLVDVDDNLINWGKSWDAIYTEEK